MLNFGDPQQLQNLGGDKRFLELMLVADRSMVINAFNTYSCHLQGCNAVAMFSCMCALLLYLRVVHKPIN